MSEPAEARPTVARQAIETFQRMYRERFDVAPAAMTSAAWAPGRINLIGEHTDYNDGFVLPAAIDRLVALAGCPSEEPYAEVYSGRHDQWARFHMGTEAEDEKSLPLWARYIAATWRQLALEGLAAPVKGFVAAVVGDVPLGAGLSSSAALEVASAMFARALGGPEAPPIRIARLCQRAEQEGSTVRVGIMDQAASCLGTPGHAILLDCRSLEAQSIAATLPGAAWLVFDTGTPHTLATSEYNVRRAQCEEAVARLAPALLAQTPGRRVEALRDVSMDDLARHGTLLPDTLLRRARHVVTENLRTLQAADELRAGDAAAIGALLNASHASLRDDYQVSSAELDAAVEIALAAEGTYGARMMGAGFGGSILALVRRDKLPSIASRLTAEYRLRTHREGALLVCAISGQTGVDQAPFRA